MPLGQFAQQMIKKTDDDIMKANATLQPLKRTWSEIGKQLINYDHQLIEFQKKKYEVSQKFESLGKQIVFKEMLIENLQNKKARFEKIVKIQEKTVQSKKDSPVKKFEANVKIQEKTVQSNKDSLVQEFEADDESWVNDDSFKEY